MITISSVNGYWETPVDLTCSVAGPSPLPTCSFSEPSVTPGSSPVASTLTVNMPTLAALDARVLPRWISFAAPFALGLVFAGGSYRGRKGRQILCMLVVLAAFCIAQTGCGGNAMNSKANPQSYVVRVIANSGDIQLASQVTVTMQ